MKEAEEKALAFEDAMELLGHPTFSFRNGRFARGFITGGVEKSLRLYGHEWVRSNRKRLAMELEYVDATYDLGDLPATKESGGVMRRF